MIGQYIVDFYCACAKLVIEVDASQHFDQERIVADNIRDQYLQDLGLTVKRYTNDEINNDFMDVCSNIYDFIFSDEK